MTKSIILLGKNAIAVHVATAVRKLYSEIPLIGVPNGDDRGEDGWQPSFRKHCKTQNIHTREISDVEQLEDALILSLECDKVLNPARFRSDRLFNIHFSALPKYRGVLTSVWPIMNGESESGVTLHRVDAGIDTGEIVDQIYFPIDLDDTAEILYRKYLRYGTDLVEKNLDSLVTNSERSIPQPFIGATYYSRKSIDFKKIEVRFFCTSYQVHNQVRAFCFSAYQLPVVMGRKIKSSNILQRRPTGKPGTIADERAEYFDINTLDGQVRLTLSVDQNAVSEASS